MHTVNSRLVRPAEVADSDVIVRLIRENLSSELLPFTIYAGEGVAAFVNDQLKFSTTRAATRYFVVEQAEAISGVVEMRCDPEGLFLNHIYVSSALRRSGLGRLLLARSIEHCAAGQTRFALDVAEHNVSAKTWYQKMGLRAEREITWQLIDLENDVSRSDSGEMFVQDMHISALLEQRYGFGRFSAVTPTAGYTVGVIGSNLFRISIEDGWRDLTLLAGLGRLDAHRQLLLIGGRCAPDLRTRCVAKSIRMAASLSDVTRALAAQRS